MRDTPHSETDRGQAYTLEGFVSAMIVLMAVLFALQSVVITPTTGGLADRTSKAQLEQEAQDALVIAANGTAANESMTLSEMVRYWNEGGDGEFHNADPEAGEGAYNTSNDSEFYQQTVLGQILRERFTERGLSYNVELIYQNESNEHESRYFVDQGKSAAVTASYTVPLYDSDNLTAPGYRDRELSESTNYPIPEAGSADGSELYNVVEVRVSVW
ncbi:hypothetical protein C477_20414 [Haloterrigena salina JCM 13891]|uniref:Uncharacterized protein n=1 Tax=Haloterrigena salina JCM 13891 TaxID=1227488 RepID=M0BUC8_9EURY|nr:hypothetical protein [Haloterrigena salina]ELZ14540.1 hypothetical protein C477_20414 [Haloterrigena salina JCM 13891]